MTHDDEHDHHRHDHGHTHGHVHGHTHDGLGGRFGAALREVFAPHSHDAADSIDDALESAPPASAR